MKKILLMFVVLITSIANAQTTDFDFSCSSSEVRANRSALITDLEGTNGVTNITVAYQSNDDYVYIATSKGRFYFASDDGNYTENTSQVGSGHLEAYSQGSFDTRLLAFKIFLDPSFELTNSIEAMYDADTHPETLASVIFDAAGVAYDNRSDNASDPRLAFISKLDKFGVVFEGFNNSNGNRYVTFVDDTIDPIQAPVDGVNLTTADFQEWMLRIARGIWLYEHQDYMYEQRKLDRIAEILAIDVADDDDLSIRQDASTFFISNGDTANVSEVVISDAILYAYDATDFLSSKTEVQTAYGVQSTKLGTRTARIGTLKNNGNGYVTVTHRYDDGRGDLFSISYGGSTQHEYANTHSGGAYIRLESLTSVQYSALNNAIIARVSNLTPTVAKELAAWFGDTDTAPVGSAPRWLPDALYDKANTLSNGTERFALIVDGLLSAHGVTITRGGAGGTGATVTTFILSKGDGYDVTFDWGAYSANGFNGSNASPELYRNLVFDVIKAGWKLVNETNNTKRSDMLDIDLDIPGNNVELQTYGSPNFDWWIYFNVDGLQIPILSGGVSGDPMFYNKHTVNPHDTYMTEVEFQRLVVFVTYMRDNFDRLKGITGKLDRHSEILTMATVEFGATVSPLVSNGDGTYHYTFNKNGNSNMYPVQTNWTHPAGTALETLSPDNWVKLYAKARGILIGL